jgi:hypothetical protein
VPETVCDQLRLWQAERNRVTMHEGILYDAFPTAESFKVRAPRELQKGAAELMPAQETEKYAKQIKAHIWSNPQKRYLFCKESGHEQIKAFIRSIIPS